MTTKTTGNGNAGVTTQPKNGAAVKPTTGQPKQLTEAEKADLERKARLEEQQKYFDGLTNLTSMRGRYEYHKKAVNRLTIDDEEMEQFETKMGRLGIIIKDSNGGSYDIQHPYLVKLVCEFITNHFDQKIAECEDKILNYRK